ncbi:glycosyltransferase [Undibacterium squillarum]|nr:glycosyltransferase [Undibacterium squillarum]
MTQEKNISSLQLTCLISLYHRDNPTHFKEALESIGNQTIPANEVVVVQDGPVGEQLTTILNEAKTKLPLKLVQINQNVGRGEALRIALPQCTHELVAIMDGDDISKPYRFEKQIEEFKRDSNLLIIGGCIEEFNLTPGDLKQRRNVPLTNEEIRNKVRRRNPFNQMTVMFRKSAALEAGGYRHSIGFEDYDLWLRLLKLNGNAKNLEDILVDARVGNGMLDRRRGFSYIKSEIQFFFRAFKEKSIKFNDLAASITLRLAFRLLPQKILKYLYIKILRK